MMSATSDPALQPASIKAFLYTVDSIPLRLLEAAPAPQSTVQVGKCEVSAFPPGSCHSHVFHRPMSIFSIHGFLQQVLLSACCGLRIQGSAQGCTKLSAGFFTTAHSAEVGRLCRPLHPHSSAPAPAPAVVQAQAPSLSPAEPVLSPWYGMN